MAGPRAGVELDFRPVENRSPKILTPQQIDQYNELGYVHPFRIFNEAEVERNRAYLEYLLAELKTYNDGRDSYAINCYQGRCEGIYDLATDPRILDLVEDITGPNIVCWATHYFVKQPHDPKSVAWHQDASYWPITPARTVTVWLAIDDATVENSAMQVIPRTHNMGHISWRKTKQDAVLDQEIDVRSEWDEPASLELDAGSVSLHADMIVHGSQPNRSPSRRAGLTLRFCPPEVRPIDPSWATDSIICRGEDPYGHWANTPRPCGNNLNLDSKPKAIGGN